MANIFCRVQVCLCFYFHKFRTQKRHFSVPMFISNPYLFILHFSGVEQFVGYRVGLISGQFYNVLGSKDKPGFIQVSWQSLILIIGITLTKSVRVFTSNMMAIAWRLSLTRALHEKYFSKSTYYKLNVLGKRYEYYYKYLSVIKDFFRKYIF